MTAMAMKKGSRRRLRLRLSAGQIRGVFCLAWKGQAGVSVLVGWSLTSMVLQEHVGFESMQRSDYGIFEARGIPVHAQLPLDPQTQKCPLQRA